MAADRRINARTRTIGDGTLHLVIKLIKRIAHAMQALKLEVSAAMGQHLHHRKRVRIVGGELRIECIARREQGARTRDIRHIRARLEREDGIIAEPRFLTALDLRIPIGAFDKAHGNAAAMAAGEISHPRDHRQSAFLIGLHREAKPVPATKGIVRAQRREQVEHEVETLRLLRIDGQCEIAAARFRCQGHQRRQQFRHHAFALQIIVAGMQRGEFDRDAGAGENIRLARRRCRFRDDRERAAIGGQITLRVGAGVGRLPQHVERIAVTGRRHVAPVAQGFVDGAAEHELTAQNAHRVADGLTDDGFAGAGQKLVEDAIEIPLAGLIAFDDMAGQHQREGRGIDEQGGRPALMTGPSLAADLVADQPVRRFSIGHAQQGFGEAHQDHALLRRERVFVEEGIDAARLRLTRTDAADEFAGEGVRPLMLSRREPGLRQPAGKNPVLIRQIGGGDGITQGICGHGNAAMGVTRQF